MRDPENIYGVAPGVDFPRALVEGLEQRFASQPPEAWAKIEIYVNTRRMQRRIRYLFDRGPARLLPQIRLITDIGVGPETAHIPHSVSPIRRQLELSQFISKLIETQPDIAPRSSLFDLSNSLATLMDEMQGEGVTPDQICALDVTDQSGHWERALEFLKITTPFFVNNTQEPDREMRQRKVVETLIALWEQNPPRHPIIIAGSTGSRGTTATLMRAVADLPQGMLILPGFDFDVPDDVWAAMSDNLVAEDHPQYRFKHLMNVMQFAHDDVVEWSSLKPPNPKFNKLISLSLRPAPVTDQWLEDGPKLTDLPARTSHVTLVEASSPRAEADVIALRLRQAAQDGITAALISPDRMLTRQVAASLDRWDIVPDDSAGLPLSLSPPGRFLRHVADLFTRPITNESLLVLLKHPLCHSGHDDRGEHLRRTRELELYLRREFVAFPNEDILKTWAQKSPEDTERMSWVLWLSALLKFDKSNMDMPLIDHINRHITLAENLTAGPNAGNTGKLWEQAAGREAWQICENLRHAADASGRLHINDYAVLFGKVISEGVVRDRDTGHPNILIWGTLEARVQGADLVILGGLNEGSWPEKPAHDPWLNRALRAQAGLLLPERKIGLSAHDYQQAVCAQDVWITRSKRSADAQTVPSRWLNRLINLLNGLPKESGPDALNAMKVRGDKWMRSAEMIAAASIKTSPAQRTSPCPPSNIRPNHISVTQIKTLIRDPYAIYAQKILRLSPLKPLVPQADAPIRGIVIHDILERFISDGYGPDDRIAFDMIAKDVLQQKCPWPTIHAQWSVLIDAIADVFLLTEQKRTHDVTDKMTELSGKSILNQSNVTLTCKADRIDLTHSGEARIYDYKTGAVPTRPQQERFDKQLLLEAAMVERGGFEKIGIKSVESAAFIGVGRKLNIVPAPLDKNPANDVWNDLEQLFVNWSRVGRGYTPRMALFSKNDPSPYDHLSRYGEWDNSDPAAKVIVE